MAFSFCRPSRGPTSTMRMAVVISAGCWIGQVGYEVERAGEKSIRAARLRVQQLAFVCSDVLVAAHEVAVLVRPEQVVVAHDVEHFRPVALDEHVQLVPGAR